MKKLISLLIVLAFPLLANAEEVEIDGLWYNLVPKAKQAEVIQYKTDQYSGDIVIPDVVSYQDVEYNVTCIGNMAFSFCSSLTSVTIGNSVTSIGDHAFSRCTALTSINIPNSVTSISAYAFYGSSSLTSVTIGNNVANIGPSAFQDCTSLTSVNIPKSVTNIGESAFSGCFNLTSVYIYDVAAWCKISFSNNTANPLYYAHHLYLNGEEVKNLVIPNSVTRIGYRAFQGCYSLTSVTIPNSVTRIDDVAFCDCSNLSSITIPNSVNRIGRYAFYGCSDLISVTIPNSVTYIDDYTFYSCSGLTSITIPNSVITIGSQAFYGCSGLTTLTIGSGIKSIGGQAFANCQELLDVYCYAEAVPKTNGNAFDNSYPNYATLHVPAVSLETYKSTGPWSSFGTFMTLDGESPEETAGVKQLQALPVLIQAEGGEVSVDGAPEGTRIAVYDASGVELGSAISRGGKTMVPAHMASSSIAIVKIGERSVKVAMK